MTSSSCSKLDKLRALKQEWSECIACPLSNSRKKIIFADGPPDADIMIVAEAPGWPEEKHPEGLPLLGPAGVMLGTWLKAAGITRDDVHITNAVMCKPEDMRAPSNEEVAACRPRLMEHIRLVDPVLVIALGAVALRAIQGTKKKVGILKARGVIADLEIQGASGKYTLPVLPMLHPSFVLREPDPAPGGNLANSIDDMVMAVDVVKLLNNIWHKQANKDLKGETHG